MDNNRTKGVEILLGDPKKAVVKLAVPMMIGMLVQAMYNLVDGIWVAGIGTDALAAIGLFFPVFMIIISIATGLSIGGSSAISRKIGANDKNGADSAAIHTLVLTMITGIVLTAILFPFLKNIFASMGAKDMVLEYVVGYSQIIIGFSVFVFFSNVASGILRGEGDTKRAMYIMVLSSVLNIGLDPLFIYTFKMGVYGAAWATMASIFLSAIFLFKWLFINKDTYVNFKFKVAKYSKDIVRDISKVGIPASFAQLSMALAMFLLNLIIIKASGTDGIAIFTSSWRIIMFGLVPLFGVSVGVTSVTGAAFGSKNPDKLRIGYLHGVKIGIFIELGVSALILIFANQISYLFTYSEATSGIAEEMIKSMRILALFLPFVPLGMVTSSMFQGIGKGNSAFAVTFLRTIIFQVFFSYFFSVTLNMGLSGIWWGIISGNISAAIIAFIWGQFALQKLKRNMTPDKQQIELDSELETKTETVKY